MQPLDFMGRRHVAKLTLVQQAAKNSRGLFGYVILSNVRWLRNFGNLANAKAYYFEHQTKRAHNVQTFHLC